MNILLSIALVAMASAIVTFATHFIASPHRSMGFANAINDEDVETVQGGVAYKTDDTVSTRHLLFKGGSDANHIAICGAAYKPIGTVDNKSLVAEDRCTLLPLLAAYGTRKMVASGAISAFGDVFTAASGKVQATPTTAGTYYKVGVARTAAAADGDVLDVYPQAPVKVIVLALPGNTDAEISGLTIGGTYSQSEIQAFRTKAEELADDFRAMSAAATEPTLFMWLTA